MHIVFLPWMYMLHYLEPWTFPHLFIVCMRLCFVLWSGIGGVLLAIKLGLVFSCADGHALPLMYFVNVHNDAWALAFKI